MLWGSTRTRGQTLVQAFTWPLLTLICFISSYLILLFAFHQLRGYPGSCFFMGPHILTQQEGRKKIKADLIQCRFFFAFKNMYYIILYLFLSHQRLRTFETSTVLNIKIQHWQKNNSYRSAFRYLRKSLRFLDIEAKILKSKLQTIRLLLFWIVLRLFFRSYFFKSVLRLCFF